jgi:putative copper export protein
VTSLSEGFRLSLHVLGATVWVGGQLTLAFLVPVLRRFGSEATTSAARQFSRVAWPAFVLLVGTGIWNVIAVDPGDQTPAWRATFGVKMGVVALSALAAFVHGRSKGRAALAVWGALSGALAIAAMVLGVVIAG